MKRLLPILLLCLATAFCRAQAPADSVGRDEWQTICMQLCNEMSIDDNTANTAIDGTDVTQLYNVEELYAQLCEFEAIPLDINNADADDFRQLLFLTDQQKEELTEYVDTYRPLHSLGELAMIESIDPMRLRLLQHIVAIRPIASKLRYPSPKQLLRYGKHELVGAATIPFYTRRGDVGGYYGYKYKHWMRYKFTSGQYLQFGFGGSQDAGEPFFAHGNSLGYDHYSYYVVLRKLGIVKTLALGQYKLKFAHGLVMNTGMTLGKTTSLLLSTPTNSVAANTSRSDAYYLQGAAITLNPLRHFDITTFFSFRPVDATLDSNGNISTLLHTGYHRTESELLRKHNTQQLTTGGNIAWRNNGFQLGATAVYTSLNRLLQPKTSQLYRRYYPAGKRFLNISANYGYQNHCLNIHGETAINKNYGIATVNTIAYTPLSLLTLTAIQRYYSYRYHSLFSASFSEGGRVQNESGLYLGATWQPTSRLSLLAYADYAYFPWARYRVSTSSHAIDTKLQASYTLTPSMKLLGSYRMHIRQQDYVVASTKQPLLINKYEHKARLAFQYAGLHIVGSTQADGTLCRTTIDSMGWMLMQTIGYKNRLLTLAATAAYFRTHDYDSRLYAYERGLLYSFSSTMFYGKGMRGTIFGRVDIGKTAMIICKVGLTKYFDRDHISSSYQRIDQSYMADMSVQLRLKF